jgi:hypothetical protein
VATLYNTPNQAPSQRADRLYVVCKTEREREEKKEREGRGARDEKRGEREKKELVVEVDA